MTDCTIRIEAEQILNWLNVLIAPGSTAEMRVLYDNGAPHIRHYESDNLLPMARDALRLGSGAAGIYWLMNPLPIDWNGAPAKDDSIVQRRWLLVDCDPTRTGTVSSTNEEKELARAKMTEVDLFLADRGWPAPIIDDSGNGWHLLFRIDLPGDDDELVHRVLQVLARRFDDDSVSIDTRVANPSRICKLYGTVAAKGENTPDRPHRVSRIVTIPESIEVVPVKFLHDLADELSNPIPTESSTSETQGHRVSRPEAINKARSYLVKMGPSISGNSGHDRLLHAASVLVNDFGLTDDESFHLLNTDFNPRCTPPWDEPEIRRKIQEAKKNPPSRSAKGLAVTSETTLIVDTPWPEPLDDAAYYGVAGDIVRKIEPHTEADPVAILIQILVAAGNVIGRHCYFAIEATRHYANLFAVLVGSSSSGRKGTSGDQVNSVMRQADDGWFRDQILCGLVSGEGLIWQVRDPIIKREPVREGGKKDGKVLEYQNVITDAGVIDKRLLGYETEFSSLLKAKSRDKNSLSEVLRQAWDSGRLRTAAKTCPAQSTDAHISLIGHITREELRSVTAEVDLVNGLANRFLWCCVKRSKLLPDGGQVHKVDFELEIAKLKGAVEFASEERSFFRDADAAEEWRRLYPELTAERPGAVGAVCNRGAAQVVRLSLLYAILDLSPVIELAHLRAALALWNYCEASVRYIFGSSLANRTADAILHELRQAGGTGISRTVISDLFHRNKKKAEIDTALQLLVDGNLARRDTIQTSGRSTEMWFLK